MTPAELKVAETKALAASRNLRYIKTVRETTKDLLNELKKYEEERAESNDIFGQLTD